LATLDAYAYEHDMIVSIHVLLGQPSRVPKGVTDGRTAHKPTNNKESFHMIVLINFVTSSISKYLSPCDFFINFDHLSY
jgi:hypothetical protein